MNPEPFFLGRRVVASGETAEVRNPYNGELVARVCVADSTQIAEAVDLAARAFETTRRAAPTT